MGLKFRKRLTPFTWFTLNISKGGIITTLGLKGFNVNLNKTGSYLNLGLPGTGIYNRLKLNGNKQSNNGINDRSLANKRIAKILTSIKIENLDFIKSQYSSFLFNNKNGGNIYIYPGYIIIKKGNNLDIFDIKNLEIEYTPTKMIENEVVPSEVNFELYLGICKQELRER